MVRTRFVLWLSLLGLWGCGPDQGVGQGTYGLYEPSGEWKGRKTFFDFPYPSDLRLTADGLTDYAGFPNSTKEVMQRFPQAASGTPGFPVLPVGYFRFNAPLAPREASQVLEASIDSPLLLIGLGDQPRLFPVASATPRPDVFVPENLLAVGVAPGVVLAPKRQYAFVVRRDLNDAAGQKLGVHPVFAQLMRGETPEGEKGAALQALHAPLLKALEKLKLPWHEVAAATVFTTHDALESLEALSGALRARHSVTIEGLTLDTGAELATAPYCHLTATLRLPQFQKGTPPFDSEGLFELGADGLPVVQREEVAKVSFTVPRQAMPAGGYRLVLYFHGSGGVASEFMNGGDDTPESRPLSQWPGWVLGSRGFAMAGASMPISPDRVPNVSAFAYLNLSNPVALRDTFRQGVIESRLFLDALERLEISPAVLSGCSGVSLPAGASAYRFSLERLSAQGQSMGGMYTNMVGAMDPRIQAVVPTGAGGFWTHFAMDTPRIPEPPLVLGAVLGTGEDLTYLHPAMHLIQAGWEPVDPIISVPRLAYRPLPGHPVRSIYQPVGDADSYFSRATFDAMVSAYRHPLAGNPVWSSTQESLQRLSLTTETGYPAKHNLLSEDGTPYTGVAAQYTLGPDSDGHRIYRKSDAVIHQYACFHATFRATGEAVVVAPDQPCPQ